MRACSRNMNTVTAAEQGLAQLQNLLASVPFSRGSEPQCHFLNIYKISHAELAALDLTEARWDQLFPISANKLLKLGISLGNLLRSYELELDAFQRRTPHLLASDPFDEALLERTKTMPAHHLLFARNFVLILKNFNVGVARRGKSDDLLSGTASLSTSGSPIKLRSRQLLIEKLEINIRLDCLFTIKVVLQMLVASFEVALRLLRAATELGDTAVLSTIRVYSESLSEVSKVSGTPSDFFTYLNEALVRVSSGVVEPLTALLLEELVEPLVIASCQNLVAGM